MAAPSRGLPSAATKHKVTTKHKDTTEMAPPRAADNATQTDRANKGNEEIPWYCDVYCNTTHYHCKYRKHLKIAEDLAAAGADDRTTSRSASRATETLTSPRTTLPGTTTPTTTITSPTRTLVPNFRLAPGRLEQE